MVKRTGRKSPTATALALAVVALAGSGLFLGGVASATTVPTLSVFAEPVPTVRRPPVRR
jgi:hypothetical protein